MFFGFFIFLSVSGVSKIKDMTTLRNSYGVGMRTTTIRHVSLDVHLRMVKLIYKISFWELLLRLGKGMGVRY